MASPDFAPVVGRLAPSPTGAQHIGNARTYLIAWLSARSRQGRVVLRIEDIDSPRIKAGAAELACDDLHWLGLDWDGEPIVQTRRLSHYQAALEQLQASGLVYPCTCTRSDVERSASAPHAEHEGPIYPGTCSQRQVADAVGLVDHPYAWRMRTDWKRIAPLLLNQLCGKLTQVTADGSAVLAYSDGYRGKVSLNLRAIGGDFVVWKSAGTPAYQLAVVVDDADQRITEVIRGDDLVPSTPRQLLLYHALKRSTPSFAHVPLVVGTDGRRLAKRHGDTRLISLRQAGVPADALVGLLAWSCGWLDHPEPITPRDLLTRFDLASIPSTPFVLTPAHLNAIGYRPNA